MIAADPIKEHKQYRAQREREEEEDATEGSQASESLLTSEHSALEAIEEGLSAESDFADSWQAAKQARKFQRELIEEEAAQEDADLILASNHNLNVQR